MCFSDVLRRYHLPQIQYVDGNEFDEKDYTYLFQYLFKYFSMKKYFKNTVQKDVREDIDKKIEFMRKNSLIPLSEEDVMDVFMDIKDELVL